MLNTIISTSRDRELPSILESFDLDINDDNILMSSEHDGIAILNDKYYLFNKNWAPYIPVTIKNTYSTYEIPSDLIIKILNNDGAYNHWELKFACWFKIGHYNDGTYTHQTIVEDNILYINRGHMPSTISVNELITIGEFLDRMDPFLDRMDPFLDRMDPSRQHSEYAKKRYFTFEINKALHREIKLKILNI